MKITVLILKSTFRTNKNSDSDHSEIHQLNNIIERLNEVFKQERKPKSRPTPHAD